MFELLFHKPAYLARHREAPYAEERSRYLSHCARAGYSQATLQLKARELLWIARKLSVYPDLHVTLEQIETVAQEWGERQRQWGQKLNQRWTRTRFVEVARAWLRFLGCLHKPQDPIPFAEKLESFARWEEREKGLAHSTIKCRAGFLGQFFRWYGGKKRALEEIGSADIDAFLVHYGANGHCRVTMRNMANILRAFFRYGALNGWCHPKLPDLIRGPRIFSCETLPAGPNWSQVRQLLSDLDTDHPADVRDRPILMLFAIYGLRASEVTALRLEDLDWEHDLIHVRRVKTVRIQSYPLLPSVGNAILRYIRNVRPSGVQREIFLKLLPPLRPLTRSCLYSLTRKRLIAASLQAPHYGPHLLRHACAVHLLSEGLTLKEIGDHLGHRSASATRIYAKVDLVGLREVADFDLGGLL